MFSPFSRNPSEKINSAFHFLFLGLVFIVPFCFLIFDYEYKLIRNNKVHNNNDEKRIAQSVNLGLTKRIKAWREDDSRERCCYALLSFSTALLAGNPDPRVFFMGVGVVHVIGLTSSLFCREIKISTTIQQLEFLLFHGCFTSLYYI